MTAIKQQTKLRMQFQAPVTASGMLPTFTGISAIIFRNAGDATVNFAGGLYTLDSKETLSLNVTEDDGLLFLDTEIAVTFDTTTGSVQKLQIITLKKSPC